MGPDQGYYIRICTEKTETEATLPISHEALELCGEWVKGLVFKGLTRAMTHLPLKQWIATGGKNGAFNREAMSVLKNRQVLLFPDLGATEYWRGKMEMMQRLGIEVSLFDFMENNATDEERKAGYDIADYILKAETKESVLSRMIARNPHLETLISTLDLEVVGVEKLS